MNDDTPSVQNHTPAVTPNPISPASPPHRAARHYKWLGFGIIAGILCTTGLQYGINALATSPASVAPTPTAQTENVATPDDTSEEKKIASRNLQTTKQQLDSAIAAAADAVTQADDLKDEAAEIIEPPAPTLTTLEVQKGDTLMKMLLETGIPRQQAYYAIEALNKIYDPRAMKIGQKLQISYMEESSAATEDESSATVPAQLLALSISPSVDRTIEVQKDGEANDYKVSELKAKLENRTERFEGIITSSLYVDAIDAGVPASSLVDMIRLMSYDVDFQRDIQPGNSFKLLLERVYTANGQFVRNGAIKFAAIQFDDRMVEMFPFTDKKKHTEYFNGKGQSIRKALLRTPINGARISSGYGRRRHPVLGYSKMHKGVDFAAPRGTPIFSAGDGYVERIGPWSSYGNYIRIRHGDTYSTAYAHMKGFARGLRKGQRIRQGQVIGYVGTTGRSTGPHLHYEVLKNGKQVNPSKVTMPPGRHLKGKELDEFNRMKNQVRQQYAQTPVRTKMASNN